MSQSGSDTHRVQGCGFEITDAGFTAFMLVVVPGPGHVHFVS